MRIAFLQDDFPPASFGGAGFSVYELAKGMQDAGHEVSVITTCQQEAEAGQGEYDGLPVYRIRSEYPPLWRAWRGLYNPPVLRELDRLLRRLRPDVVHANNIHYHLSWYSLKIAKRHTAKVVVTFRDAMAVSYGKLDTARYLETLDARLSWLDQLRKARLRFNPFRNAYIRMTLSFADGKYAVSDALANALAQNGIPGVTTIHTGIDHDVWQVAPERGMQFRERHGLVGKKIILFGGRVGVGKGQVQALRALDIVRARMPEAVLLVMGGSARPVENGIAETGWIAGEEKKDAYAAADVVWAPSMYLDPLPRMVLEAMAAGKPVIGTTYGGSPEAVADGETGFVVDPRDAKEMAERTLDLLHNAEKATAFGRAARARAAEHFNFGKYVTRYLAAYERR